MHSQWACDGEVEEKTQNKSERDGDEKGEKKRRKN